MIDCSGTISAATTVALSASGSLQVFGGSYVGYNANQTAKDWSDYEKRA